MEKKKFKLGLLPKLLIAIVLGIIIGQFFPVWFCRVVVTASSIPDRGLGILSGVRKPVPQLHERRRSGTDRRHG